MLTHLGDGLSGAGPLDRAERKSLRMGEAGNTHRSRLLMFGSPVPSLPIRFARLGAMSASPRTIQLRLTVLAVFSLAAGVLPWIAGGPLVAELLGIPFLLVALFAGFAAYRYPAVVAEARARTVGYPAEPVGGCACGQGG